LKTSRLQSSWIKIGKKLEQNYEKILGIVEGGRTRVESMYNAILFLERNFDYSKEKIIFNDAVRPFVSTKTYNEMLRKLDYYEAVIFCSKIVTYLGYVEKTRFIKHTEKRDHWRLFCAPEAYRQSLLKQVVKKMNEQDITRYESFVEMLLSFFPDLKIYCYESEDFNMKITYKSDLLIADILLRNYFKHMKG